MPTEEQATEGQEQRLENILGWVRTAKETLPAINEAQVGADRVARMSALLDRLHESAVALRKRTIAAYREHRAA